MFKKQQEAIERNEGKLRYNRVCPGPGLPDCPV